MTNLLLILAAALLPAVVLWMYVWRRDPRPEPMSRLLKATLLGMLVCAPVALTEMVVSIILWGPDGEPSTLLGTTVQAFATAALPEEGFKLLCLWLVLRRNPYFDEHFDGIVYAVCIGLGFAAVENVGYLIAYSDSWPTVAVSRALLAVPGHYAFAVLMGYYYSTYTFVSRTPRTAACILLVPVLAHGIYDMLAMGGEVSPLMGSVGFFVLLFFCHKLHGFCKQKMMAQLRRDGYHTNLG